MSVNTASKSISLTLSNIIYTPFKKLFYHFPAQPHLKKMSSGRIERTALFSIVPAIEKIAFQTRGVLIHLLRRIK